MAHYVTTPIYYVNSTPHLGHAYSTIAADVVDRFQKLMGEETYFLTGTDEHGANVAAAAEKAGEDIKEFVDRNAQRFRDLLPVLNVEPSYFIRTTDPQHESFAAEIAQKLFDQGDIYEGTYTGKYCQSCEAYYSDADLLEGDLCPTHKRPVVELNEKNYFFRLSAYQDRLLEHFEKHPDWVKPSSRYNEALSLIKSGLEDISISRASISWGIPVPWDASQVLYVWIDALFNYASGLTYGTGTDVTDKFWPPNLQILANDIIRFHAVYWPAFLMACGMDIPKRLQVHGYLLMGGEKMSKTQGNVFDPFPVIEQHGADPVRFYVLREVQFGKDGSVSQESFEQRYTSELANDLGNLVSRTASMAGKYLDDGVVPVVPSGSSVASDAATMRENWEAQMKNVELSEALESVWVFVRGLNKHVEDRAPWALAKDESQAGLLADTLAELVEGLIAVARALSPFMPETAVRIAGVFGVEADELQDWTWGGAAGRTVGTTQPLFPRLEQVV
jgi:methionyl-tRNA synthetase